MLRSYRLVLSAACLGLAACSAPRAGEASASAATSAATPSSPSVDAAAAKPATTAAPTPPPAESAEPPVFPRADCLADFDELARRAAADWAYADDKRERAGVDLQTLASEAKHSLADPSSRSALSEALRRFVAAMQDGQAVDLESSFGPPGSRTWPFTVVDTSDGIVIGAVAEGTPDLLPGDVLIAVDREPIEARIGDELARVSASTAGARRAAAMDAMRRSDEPHVRCLVQRPAGPLMEIRLDTLPVEHDPPAMGCGCLETDHRRIGDIGYLCAGALELPLFVDAPHATPEQQRALLAPTLAAYPKAFAELADTRALILDLRGTSGLDVATMEIARHLVPAGATWCQLQSRRDDGQWSPMTRQALPPGAAHESDTRPLVVLIDERTFGAADTLAACLRDQRPGTRFVGRPTAGSPAAQVPPLSLTLARTGASIRFPVQRVYDSAGTLIEGRGVIPDVVVRWSRDDVVMARDPDLEAALALLAQTEP